ncbi:RdgB/HAM1 family non-canonical purine NTP pyrophosphatase [Pseudoroseicyclus aestuarii]|uniref:dITP/XTP pyrophosphatase n=1 Tax=Pseudoroseicyclus aestuarii TaxID=1795041 RepID=A0A318T7U4_9RHOB|nr:RdgB/HAM1 family non-canonical purine NTP pyrophosphatase [Pseudoroseicyclus aestuarii]PYE84468.1 XTP/dITP diphosphohydrolase [Pseudoroseicyclus aestuarii]
MSRRLRAGESLVVATHNAGKLAELRDLLAPHGLTVTSNADHALPEPEETEETFVGNARIKAHAAAKATGLPALADDSGVVIDALSGKPGVHTADWAETPNGRDFTMAMDRVREELQDSAAPQPWTAAFCCTLVLAWPNGEDRVFEGRMPGQIVWPMRGTQGHGYDPIFQPEGETRTFAEMTPEEKSRISHRGKALAAFVEGCLSPRGDTAIG